MHLAHILRHAFYGVFVARMLEWFAFSSGPCLSELFTITCLSWVALHRMAHSFVELHKPLCHHQALIHEGGPKWERNPKKRGCMQAEIDVFLELSCFFNDPVDVGNLISGSSAFSKTSLNIWKFTVHVLLKPGLENFEHYFTSM